jgi:hypothetical protein
VAAAGVAVILTLAVLATVNYIFLVMLSLSRKSFYVQNLEATINKLKMC